MNGSVNISRHDIPLFPPLFSSSEAAKHSSLKDIPKTDLKKFLSKIERLADDPRPTGSQKLTGFELYRLRQEHGIVYSILDSKILAYVVKVGHRKNDYR